MRKLIVVAASILLSVGAGLGAAAAEEIKAPDKEIMIHLEGGKKPGVVFNHQQHFEANEGLQDKCETCHHMGKESVEKMKCRNCHGLEADDEKMNIKDAMHKKDVGKCYQCHFPKDSKKKLKCNDCHKK